MRIIVTTDSTFVALGGDSLTAGEEQEARDSKLTHTDVRTAEAQLATLGGPGELYHDAATDSFKVRSRAKRANEVDDDDRRDLAQRLKDGLDGWAQLTAPQKDALLRLCVRAVLRVMR